MKQALAKAWLARRWSACLLWPVSQVYRFLIRLRLTLYKRNILESRRFAVPVVVVGNVVAGGGGKTPLVIALVSHLQAQGLHAGVVSRGYGRSSRETLEVRPDMPVLVSGDEPALIQKATSAPVFIAVKRSDAVQALLAAHPETNVVVCDDGLQHRALERDIEIIVFDDRGVGNGWLLPAGPLREPWPRPASAGQQLVLHTGQNPAFSGFSSQRRLASHGLAANGDTVSLDRLRGQPLTALAGIASPEIFFAMLRDVGLKLERTIALPDHIDFAQASLDIPAGTTVLCTEKDAVKLFRLPGSSRWKVLAIPLLFAPEEAFLKAFDACLAPLLPAGLTTTTTPPHLPSGHGHQIT